MKFSARNLVIVLILFIGFLTFTGAFFIVQEWKQAIVLQFGEPRQVITEPGLTTYFSPNTSRASRQQLAHKTNSSTALATPQAQVRFKDKGKSFVNCPGWLCIRRYLLFKLPRLAIMKQNNIC